MGIFARSFTTDSVNSYETGLEIGRRILDGFGDEKLALFLYCSTLNHDQPAFVRGVREATGPAVPSIGCSTQGLISRGFTSEDGYVAGAIGLGGSSLRASTGYAEDIHVDPLRKGAALGRSLMKGLGEPPKAVVLLYDPLCGADMDLVLQGLFEEVRCPIIGGGAGQPYGAMVRTFQYFGDRVFNKGAVATALTGALTVEMDVCHGASPLGVEMMVTKAEGTTILELDGRPALDVWEEITGAGPPHLDHTAALAIGLPVDSSDSGRYLVRAAFGSDLDRKGVVIQAGLPSGSKVMLHHRTVQGLLDGTAKMADRLRARLEGKAIRAVLGFECGARTKPFIGQEATLKENIALQETLSKDAEWFGLFAWGELYPMGGRPAFHNYTYPVLVLAD
jgi:hypothetical protein